MGMDIEKLATSAIEDAIAKTDYITPYVNSGDKEPCWDGYFYAYTGTSKKYEFPTNKNEIANIILNFVRDKESQVLLRNGKSISLEEIVEQIGLDKCCFTFSYTGLGYNTKEPYKYLFEHDVYLYAECKDLNLKVPIDHMWRAEFCKTELDGEVRVGNVIYYNGYEVFHKPDSDEIHIGKSIKFIIRNDGTAKVQYKLSGNLDERIVAEEMLIELIKEKTVFVNNVRLEINPSEDELKCLFCLKNIMKK